MYCSNQKEKAQEEGGRGWGGGEREREIVKSAMKDVESSNNYVSKPSILFTMAWRAAIVISSFGFGIYLAGWKQIK
jgi:hypothetical protein